MAKVTLTDITSGFNSTTTLNDNLSTIETAFDNTLSRDGTAPNTMNADIDLNSNDLLNVGQINNVDVQTLLALSGLTDIDADDLATLTNNINKVITVADDLEEPISEIDTVANNIVPVNAIGLDLVGQPITLDYGDLGPTENPATPVGVLGTIYNITSDISLVAAVDDAVVTCAANIADIVAAPTIVAGALQATEDLSDVANVVTARQNLGLEIGVDVAAFGSGAAYDDVTANFTGTLQNGGSNVVVDTDIGSTVQAYDADLDAWALKTAPTGVVIGTTDTQTLSGKTITGVVLDGEITEEVYTLAGTDIDPANGTIQTKVMSGATTFTESLTDGQAITLMLEGGDTHAVTWMTMTWVTSTGNVAPTLTAKDTIVIWKISTTVYGAYTGSYV